MRVAAIDCGTNSIRLYVAEGLADGGVAELDRRLELNRLGQGVDATGRFDDAALARTFDACDRYAAVIADLGVERVRFVATSAARDAVNRDEFFAGVRARLGIDAEIISGDEEARLSFAGAVAGGGPVGAPTLVMDLGGGSTEFVTGDAGGSVVHAVSLNMGSVRVRERFLPDEVPTPWQVASAREWVDERLDDSGVGFADAATWIGVAGTVTSVSAIHQQLVEYDRRLVHRSVLTQEAIARVTDALLTSTVDEIMRLGPLQRRRAEVIGAGALILERVAARVNVDLVVSESDILDGIVAQLLAPIS